MPAVSAGAELAARLLLTPAASAFADRASQDVRRNRLGCLYVYKMQGTHAVQGQVCAVVCAMVTLCAEPRKDKASPLGRLYNTVE
jgi:hypothetical protein